MEGLIERCDVVEALTRNDHVETKAEESEANITPPGGNVEVANEKPEGPEEKASGSGFEGGDDDFQVELKEHDRFLDEQTNEASPSPSQENATRDPADDYKNNNKEQAVEPTETKEAQVAEEVDANPGQADHEDSSLEEDNRSVEFFPRAGTNKAKMAESEDQKRQLNVLGIDEGVAGSQGTMENQLSEAHEELVQFGFKFRPQTVIGARLTSNTTRSGQTVPIRVTYDSEATKSDVIKAAKAGQVWNSRQRRESGRHTYFKEATYPPKRRVQEKRKNRHEDTSDKMEPESKKAKTKQKTDSDSTTRHGEAEEAEEENKRQKFVAKELKKEERDDEIAFIANSIQDEHAKSIAENIREYFLPEQHRLRLERERGDRISESDINKFLIEQRNRIPPRLSDSPNDANDEMEEGDQENQAEGSQNPAEVELEFNNKVSDRIIPKLINHHTSSEQVSDPAPSPLYRLRNHR